MGGGMILETTFLIDLEREVVRGQEGPAHAFLERHPTDAFYITFTIAGEVASGRPPDGRKGWETLLAPFEVLPCDRDVCWAYGKTYRYLRQNGLLIGTNDLWIAATALANEKRVVTRNLKEFRRVPGLEVVGYVD